MEEFVGQILARVQFNVRVEDVVGDGRVLGNVSRNIYVVGHVVLAAVRRQFHGVAFAECGILFEGIWDLRDDGLAGEWNLLWWYHSHPVLYGQLRSTSGRTRTRGSSWNPRDFSDNF